MLRNIRVAACGGGYAPLSLPTNKYVETVQLMEKWALSEEVSTSVKHFIEDVLTAGQRRSSSGLLFNNNSNNSISNNNSNNNGGRKRGLCCMRCSITLELLIVTPCGCQYCPLCLDIEVRYMKGVYCSMYMYMFNIYRVIIVYTVLSSI